MIALPPLKLRRKTRSLAPGAAAVLLSSAVHAAILLPLIGLAWHAPGHEPEPEPARIVEVTLAWAAPAAPMPEPTPEPPAMAQPPTRIVPAAPAPRRPRPATLPAPHEAVPPLPAPPTETSGAPTTTVSEATQAPLTVAPNPQPPSGEMMAGYARQLLARLEQYKRYPALSLRRGEEGTVTIASPWRRTAAWWRSIRWTTPPPA